MDHLSRTNLRRLLKRNILLIPRRFYHSAVSILQIPHGFWNKKSYTIHQSDENLTLILQRNPGSFLWNKFRFCRHNGFSLCRLRQFIHCPLSSIHILHIWNHTQVHKFLNKCRLARPNRTYNPNIYFTICSTLNIFIQVILSFFHKKPLPHILLIYGKGVLIIRINLYAYVYVMFILQLPLPQSTPLLNGHTFLYICKASSQEHW